MTGSPTVPCPVCRAEATTRFLERRGVPVHQHTPLPDPARAVAVTRGDLAMNVCGGCGFVFNAAFDPSLLSYDTTYDNSQDHSPRFRAYTEALVSGLTGEGGVGSGLVVEVGCGKGAFLRTLVEAGGPGLRGFGFDLTYEGPPEALGGRARFERRFFGPWDAGLGADAVVCRHVIEHVPEPMEFLRNIRGAMAGWPGARLYIETPCVAWILDYRVVWDFFYEHCSLFSAGSLRGALSRAGFAAREVRHVFGGQYLWAEAVVAEPGDPGAGGAALAETAFQYAEDEARQMGAWSREIASLGRRGKVAIWGAGAKGVTFAGLVDPRRERVDCLVDLNPAKQGRFVPGTGHPIVGPADLAGRGVRSAVVMNLNYRDEIRATLDGLGLADVALVGTPGE